MRKRDDAGNSVVGALINTALATIITLVVIGLTITAYHTLVVRDAAISAASNAGIFNAPEKNRYLLRLLNENLPDLASYDIRSLDEGSFVGVEVVSQLPGFAFLAPPSVTIRAIAPRERVS
jgi:hypothetical protein